MFSTFLECFQMAGVFYHSVIHSLGFFICFMIYILRAQNNIKRFFYVLYPDRTWVFDQSAGVGGPIYIIIIDMRLLHCFGYYRYDMYSMHVYYFLGKKCGHFTNFSCIL